MLSSIIIPVYNQSVLYLEAAVKSALLQTVDVEVVVVDDGSTEPVIQLLGKMSGVSGDITCIRQDNGGVASALNAGIRQSTGEYIQWLSSDDVFRLDKTKLQLGAIGDNKVCYCAYEDGVPQSQVTWPAAQYSSQESLFGVLKEHCFINACTVMWHRSVFDEIGFFDTNMRHCQDYEFLLRCAERYNFIALNLPLVRRRTHAGQMLNTLKDPVEAESKRKDLEYLRERYGATAQVWLPNG